MLTHPEILERLFQPATGTFPKSLARQLLNVHFPPADHARYEQLSNKAQLGKLTAKERALLEDYVNLNDFLMILKTKARASLQKRKTAA